MGTGDEGGAAAGGARRGRVPCLVISGGHHDGYEIVCDVIARETKAQRAVIPGAAHLVPETGTPSTGGWRRSCSSPHRPSTDVCLTAEWGGFRGNAHDEEVHMTWNDRGGRTPRRTSQDEGTWTRSRPQDPRQNTKPRGNGETHERDLARSIDRLEQVIGR